MIEFDDRAFQAALRLNLVEYEQLAEHAVDRDADHIKERAKDIAPVADPGEDAVPGWLRDHIETDPGVRTGFEYYVDVGVDSNTVPYAVPVEFGTSKMQAEPFMRPAMAEVEARPSIGTE
jgi:HK97 gp10 family phage protein